MKTNPAVRVTAFILCVLSASVFFWSMVLTFRYWDEMWTDTDYYSSYDYRQELDQMTWKPRRLAELGAVDHPTYTESTNLSSVRASLDAGVTNYRYELRRDDTGELMESNLGGQRLEEVAEGIQMGTFILAEGDALRERDVIAARPVQEAVVEGIVPEAYEYILEDGVGHLVEAPTQVEEVLRVWIGDSYVEFPSGETPEGYNEYGWYNDGCGNWEYDYDRDSRITRTSYVLRSGVAKGLPVEDSFRDGYTAYSQWHRFLPQIGVVWLASGAAALAVLIFLCLGAGHRQGEEGICLTWFDRLPLEVLGGGAFGLVMLGLLLCSDIYHGLDGGFRFYLVASLLAITAVAVSGAVAFVLTTAVRLKAGTLLDTILLWRLCRWAWRTLCRGARAVLRAVRTVVDTLSMNIRLGLVFLVYLAINAFLATGLFQSYNGGFYFIGLVLFNGGAFFLLCRWIEQWKRIRDNTQRILGGETNVQIDTTRMYNDLKSHAEQLNDLGSAIDHAVDERMKSEHFKAELITNVSHDLKTPLTSIINYVDLLKKEPIDNPKAVEYIAVLDRKSQRLKKLTEDLVEASKASTGNVTVNAARMDLVEFTQQAAAEYQDRLTGQNLTLITKMADRPVYISADGRHMWRILDNLLGNCVKYALEGTRVYLDVVEWDGKASISVKNISRDVLNVDPSELTERFVRGDESRTTEGSGLGLSIARSLTEVQGGTFRVSTDGDLFKVSVYFPVLLALEDNNLGEVPGRLRG